METATLVAISISGLLVSFTGYALYTAFGQPSQQLRDPFEEHGDQLRGLPDILLGGSLLAFQKNEKSVHFLVGTLGGSRKKIAKKMIPRVETKRNV